MVCMHLTSIPTWMNLLSRFYLIQFFHYHELYHGLKGKFGQIWKVVISPKPKRLCPSKLVCMQLTSTPTCMNFLSRFYSIQFFRYHGLIFLKENFFYATSFVMNFHDSYTHTCTFLYLHLWNKHISAHLFISLFSSHYGVESLTRKFCRLQEKWRLSC